MSFQQTQLAQTPTGYNAGQNDPGFFTSFMQGQVQNQQLQDSQQQNQMRQLAVSQAQQQQQYQNQLNTLAPQVYTTTDPTARAALQGQLAAQGPTGQADALAAQATWDTKTAAQQTQLANAADSATRSAIAAKQVGDPAQQQVLLDNAYQTLQAGGASATQLAAMKGLPVNSQIQSIMTMALPLKDLAQQSGFGPADISVVSIPGKDANGVPGEFTGFQDKNTGLIHLQDGRTIDGRTGQVVGNTSVGAMPSSMGAPGTQAPQTPTAQPSGPVQNLGASFVKPYDPGHIQSIVAQVNAPSQYDGAIAQAAEQNGLDPRMLKAQLIAESGLNPGAANSQSTGIAQFTPATAQQMGIDPNNPQQAIAAAAKLLASNGGQTKQGFQAYYGGANQKNWGPNTQQYAANLQAVQSALGGQAVPTGGATTAAVAGAPAIAGAGMQAAQSATQPQAGPTAQNASQAPAGAPQGDLNNAMLGQTQQKMLALEAQNGPMTLPQLMAATGADPQMAQVVAGLSGLNPNLPIDLKNPDTMQQLFTGMIGAASQMPHLLPASVQAQMGGQQPGQPPQAQQTAQASPGALPPAVGLVPPATMAGVAPVAMQGPTSSLPAAMAPPPGFPAITAAAGPQANQSELGFKPAVKATVSSRVLSPAETAQIPGLPPGTVVQQDSDGKMSILHAVPEPKAKSTPAELAAANASANQVFNITKDKIDQAIQQVSPFTSAAGSLLDHIPGTSATDLHATLQTIRANVAFDKLMAMKANNTSLGRVTNTEIGLLQNTLGNLEQTQSGAQLKQNLLDAKRQIQEMQDTTNAPPPGTAAPSAPSNIDALVAKYAGH